MARHSGVTCTPVTCTLLLLPLLLLFGACTPGALGQRDCAGVDCPTLSNCIQEVLESGACCPSCVRTGCTCEGYQYYDCVHGGYQNGKVPEGEAYFVDYGSTECSCPPGGGRIICHYISCPEMPANCIETAPASEPGGVDGGEDACPQCERVGCMGRGGQKHDAGHSFHVEPCRVCHCPSQGGELMCYPVPDCDARQPALLPPPSPPAEHSRPHGGGGRGDPPHLSLDQRRRGGQGDRLPPALHLPHRLPPSGNLPLKYPPLDKMALGEEEDEEEDYEYEPEPIDAPEFRHGPMGLLPPTPASPLPGMVAVPLSRGSEDAAGGGKTQGQGYGRQNKLELRERYGVHEPNTDHPGRVEGEYGTSRRTPVQQHMTTTTTTARTSHHGNNIQRVQLLTPQAVIDSPSVPAESMTDRMVFPLHKPSGGGGGENLPPFFQANGESPSARGEKTHTDSQRLSLPAHPLEGPWSKALLFPPPVVVPPSGNQSPWAPLVEVKHPLHRLSVEEGRHLDPPFHTQSTLRSPASSQSTGPPPWGTYEPDEYNDAYDGEDLGEEREEEEGIGGQDMVEYDVEPEEEEEEEEAGKQSSPPLATDDYHHQLHLETTVEASTEPPTTTTTTSTAPTTTTTTVQPTTTTTTTAQPTTTTLAPTTRAEQPQAPFDLPSEDVAREEEGWRGKVAEEEEAEEEDPTGTPGPGPDASAGLLLRDCCAVGQRWASEHQLCSNMPLLSRDTHSMCSVAQQQCCLSSLQEAQCESGVESARAGDHCQVDSEDRCMDNTYQVCCRCCTLGLQVRREGLPCDGHQYLGFSCGHIFLTCCQGEEGALGQVTLRKPLPSTMPSEVSDRRFPQEAFSIDQKGGTGGGGGGGGGGGSNSVQEQEEVDVCQLCQHICTNTWGSHRCACRHGYTLQDDGHSCAPGTPVVEDNGLGEEDLHGQRPGQLSPGAGAGAAASTTTSTSTTTSSTPAYLNPCAGGGPCSQQCSVVGGRATCSCFPGYALTPDRVSCDDVDECVGGLHSCGVGERCVNTVGAHVCERPLTCPPGYQARYGVCEDIDECMVRTHDCGVAQQCKNTDGSFVCSPKHKCLPGFKLDSHGNCIDVNECSSLSESCSPGFTCINTVGSYSCQRHVVQCNHGYQAGPDGARCIDVDECQMGSHQCGTEQICHNLPGSYRCDCQPGYQYDAIRKVCNDVNECWRYPGRLCSQTCENTPGSYQCSCTAGFSLAFDGRHCEDLNECDTNPCSQECANIYGSYQCYCRQGFYLKEDGHTCDDIDECSQSIGNMCAFECVNVAGSYECACPAHGYTKSANGHTCKDIDECTTGGHNCSEGQSCYNIQGGYRCLSFSCPRGYKKVSDTRCERLGCPGDDNAAVACQKLPLRITYYQLSFQTDILTPAQIFRIGPSPAYAGDHVSIAVTRGNEEGYFSTRKLNGFTGAVYLQRQVRRAKDFLVDVEMRLLRQGTITTFVARIYVFITASTL